MSKETVFGVIVVAIITFGVFAIVMEAVEGDDTSVTKSAVVYIECQHKPLAERLIGTSSTPESNTTEPIWTKWTMTTEPSFSELREALAKAFPGKQTEIWMHGKTTKKGVREKPRYSADVGSAWGSNGKSIEIKARSASDLLESINKYK